VAFGGGIRSSLNDTYRRLKETEGIVEQLVGPGGEAEITTALERRPPKKPAPDWLPALQDIAARLNHMRQTDTRKQSAALSLLRSAAKFAQAVYENPDDLGDHLGRFKSVRRSMTNLEFLLDAEKYDYDI
jgi:hypothetical protein